MLNYKINCYTHHCNTFSNFLFSRVFQRKTFIIEFQPFDLKLLGQRPQALVNDLVIGYTHKHQELLRKKVLIH